MSTDPTTSVMSTEHPIIQVVGGRTQPPILYIRLPVPPPAPNVQGMWWFSLLVLFLVAFGVAGWWCADNERQLRLNTEEKLGRAVKEIQRLRSIL